MGATIRIANDIDLTGTGPFDPIGGPNNSGAFTGTFDGGGHTIKGLEISSPTQDGFGLIGTANGATIRNVRVNGSVVGNASAPGSVNGGLLVGLATNTAISNAHVEGTVSTPTGAGGLAGLLNGGSISNSTASVKVTATETAGGLVGFVNATWVTSTPATITNVRTSGTVSSSCSYSLAGGIAGSTAGTSITGSSSSAAVTGNMAGGIVGQAVSGGLPGIAISDSYSTGSVSVTSNSTGSVGGIVGGLCSDMLIDLVRNYFTGRLVPAGSATSGGIAGGSVLCPLSIATQATDTGNLWNSDTTGPAGAGGTVGVGRTTAQMKQIGTYTELGWSIANGWDANPTTTWLICPQVNDGFPFQRGQLAATACKAPAETPAATAAALTATLLPSRRRVVSGQRLRIGIRTANIGGTAAEAVTSCIRLPSNMVITSAGGALRSGRTACFRVGTVAAGGQVTKVITVRAVSTRRVTVTVTGSARATGVAKVQAAAKRVTVTPRAARARVTG